MWYVVDYSSVNSRVFRFWQFYFSLSSLLVLCAPSTRAIFMWEFLFDSVNLLFVGQFRAWIIQFRRYFVWNLRRLFPTFSVILQRVQATQKNCFGIAIEDIELGLASYRSFAPNFTNAPLRRLICRFTSAPTFLHKFSVWVCGLRKGWLILTVKPRLSTRTIFKRQFLFDNFWDNKRLKTGIDGWLDSIRTIDV